MSDAIKKLDPWQGALTRVGLRTRAIKNSRRQLERQLGERREAMLEAYELGAPRADLANAAGVSLARLHQIISGGAR